MEQQTQKILLNLDSQTSQKIRPNCVLGCAGESATEDSVALVSVDAKGDVAAEERTGLAWCCMCGCLGTCALSATAGDPGGDGATEVAW